MPQISDSSQFNFYKSSLTKLYTYLALPWLKVLVTALIVEYGIIVKTSQFCC